MFTNHSHTARPTSAVQTHTNIISAPKTLKSKSGNKSSFQGLEKEKMSNQWQQKIVQSNSSTPQCEIHGFSARESYSHVTSGDFKQYKRLCRYSCFRMLVANLRVDRDLPKCLPT